MIKIQIFYFDLQTFAKKKGGGSSKNGRDSNPNYLGIKRQNNQLVQCGTIIYMQRGTKIHPGKNVKRSKNDALYSTVKGYVKFHYVRRNRKAVSVITVDDDANI